MASSLASCAGMALMCLSSHQFAAVTAVQTGGPAAVSRGSQHGARQNSSRGGSGRLPCVLEGDHQNKVVRLLVAVEDEHPPPWPEDKPQRPPAPLKLSADPGKLLQNAQCMPDAVPGVGGKAVREDHAVEVFDSIDAKSYLGQRLELIKGDRPARTGTIQALHGVLVGARDAIKYRHDVTGVGIGFLDSSRQQ
jgi:hypothetical protein